MEDRIIFKDVVMMSKIIIKDIISLITDHFKFIKLYSSAYIPKEGGIKSGTSNILVNLRQLKRNTSLYNEYRSVNYNIITNNYGQYYTSRFC